MIHCNECGKEILHGETFMLYGGFAYCSPGCLAKYSFRRHVWYQYVHEYHPESLDYDTEYADVETTERRFMQSMDAFKRIIGK